LPDCDFVFIKAQPSVAWNQGRGGFRGRGLPLPRSWLVPSREFNQRAYRERRTSEPGRIVLQFSCLAAGDPKWDEFELAPIALGSAFVKILGGAPDSWKVRQTFI